MKRVDILKMQLLNSRGRFFTAEWKGLVGEMIKANFKVIKIIDVSPKRIRATVYIPKLSKNINLNFMINSHGDCTYIASDKSKFEMSGKQAFNF
tara:strand:- start:5 stop:286 length:282 start_codon:yes stop_codon:yes gene_type:complete